MTKRLHVIWLVVLAALFINPLLMGQCKHFAYNPFLNGGKGGMDCVSISVAAGADGVVGAAALTTANRVPVVAGIGELGQSDVSLASGIFSRAGTVGLAATGANIITLTANGTEALRVFSSDDGSSKLQVAGNIAATGNIAVTIGTGNARAISVTSGTLAMSVGANDSYGLGRFGTTSNHSWALIANNTDMVTLTEAGTLTHYNPTATTGVTRSRWTPGAGQSTIPLVAATTGNALTLGINDTIYASLTSAGVFTIANDSFILTTAKTPSSASDTGTTGQIAWDANYVYIATGSNTWKRASIATW